MYNICGCLYQCSQSHLPLRVFVFARTWFSMACVCISLCACGTYLLLLSCVIFCYLSLNNKQVCLCLLFSLTWNETCNPPKKLHTQTKLRVEKSLIGDLKRYDEAQVDWAEMITRMPAHSYAHMPTIHVQPCRQTKLTQPACMGVGMGGWLHGGWVSLGLPAWLCMYGGHMCVWVGRHTSDHPCSCFIVSF